MHTIPFLDDLALVLGAAVVVVVVCHRLKIPSVVGLLLTGVFIGPSGLGWVSNTEEVEIFAEIGVVTLLFTIGLELSFERLGALRRLFFAGGTAQVAGTVAAGAGLAVLWGFAAPSAAFLGMLLALSSTAIVLKIYADRRELESPRGRAVTAILLYQDFAIVPMLLLIPVLAGRVDASPLQVAGRFALGLGVVAAVFWVARSVMPRLLHWIVRTRIREVLVLGGLVVGLGLGLLTEALGFSLALGAFLGGILISESEYSQQVFAEVLPFRDVFNSLFFVSIGMLLDLRFAAAHLPWVLAATGGILVVKSLLLAGVLAALRQALATTLGVALSLAQVGEFSFVLVKVGADNELVGPELYQLFIAASVLTMLATPALIAAAPKLAARLPARLRTKPEEEGPTAGLENHVVVAGFGATGRNLARVLKQAAIPYCILELNPQEVRAARLAGQPILYGDAGRREVLEHARIRDAEVLVVAIPDPEAVRRAVGTARLLHPGLHIVVRTRRLVDLDELYAAGADEVIAEEFEASIEIFTRVLLRYRVPANVIEMETRLLRGENYRMLRSAQPAGALSKALTQALAGGTTTVFFVEPLHAASGKTIRELDLRRRTGASIIAVVREETPITNPPPETLLAVGTSVVLVGGHTEIRRAFEVLEGPSTAATPPAPGPTPAPPR